MSCGSTALSNEAKDDQENSRPKVAEETSKTLQLFRKCLSEIDKSEHAPAKKMKASARPLVPPKFGAGCRPPSFLEQAMLPGITRDAEVLSSSGERSPEAAQLTVFYGGSIHVYDNVPVDKAQVILLLAGESSLSAAIVPEVAKDPQQSRPQYAGKFQTELPIVRRNSLRHFLEKRKSRKINKCLHASSSTASPQES